MHDIEQKAIEIYTKNLAYLSKEHPDLHRKIELLSLAIQNGQYKEKYAIEYKGDGYFDLLELATDKWLYGSNSKELAKKAADRINYNKTDGVIETFYNFKFEESASDTAKNTDPTISPFATTAPVISYINNIIDKRDSTMQKIYKFIFFGTGLGVHIDEIDKKIDASIYLIVEDDLEIFRASLFVTDYSRIGAKSKIYFTIMDNDYNFKEIFNKFFHEAFIRNNYLKYSLLNEGYLDKIRKIQNFIVTSSHITYPHHKLLEKNIRTLKTLDEHYKFFNVSKPHHSQIFSTRPVILVAAGPSLDKNIEWLKNNSEYATVVALFMTTPILFKHGITPDIIIHIDEQDHPVLSTLSNIDDLNRYRESIFFLAPSVKIDLFKGISQKNRCYLFEDRTRYRFEMGFLEGFSVGEIAYALTIIWGTKELYLLGLDLAVDKETGKTHAKGHISEQHRFEANETADTQTVSLRGSIFEVKGNFRKTVATTPLFDMSIHRVNYFTKTLKQGNQNIYNLSDGAYFEEVTPIRPEDVNLGKDYERKSDGLLQDLLECFDSYASEKMTPKELEMFNLRIQEAEKKLEAVERFAETRYPSIIQFRAAFTDIASNMITPPENQISELSQILIIYLQNIGGYVGDFLNTKEVDNPKRHIKQLQKIIAGQLKRIIKKYLEAIRAGSPAH